MDHTLHTEAELAHLLRLIRGTKASGGNRQECEALEDIVHAADRALKSARAAIEDALRRDEDVQDSVNSCIVVVCVVVLTSIMMLLTLVFRPPLLLVSRLSSFLSRTCRTIAVSRSVLMCLDSLG